MEYTEVCKDLGVNPEIHFVTVTNRGTISFTIGKPDEIKTLRKAVINKGYKPSRKLNQIR